MKEVSQEEHNKVMVSSITKFMEVYKRNGGFIDSNLKIVDVVYRLMNDACSVVSRKDKQRLSKIYYRLIRQDRLICSPVITRGLGVKDKFTQFHPVESKPVVGDKCFYYQVPFTEGLGQIKATIEASIFPSGIISFTLESTNKGFEFTLDKSGRLSIILEGKKSINSITDVLGNNVIDQFDLSIINNNFVIISKNIFTEGLMFLKIN